MLTPRCVAGRWLWVIAAGGWACCVAMVGVVEYWGFVVGLCSGGGWWWA